MRIVIVDDEPDMLDYLERVFRGDHEVVRAPDAAAALAAVAEKRPDVLVTDQHMPGVGGVELASRALALHAGLAVVLLSGFGDGPGAPIPGIHVRVGKPADSIALRAAVAEALRAVGR